MPDRYGVRPALDPQSPNALFLQWMGDLLTGLITRMDTANGRQDASERKAEKVEHRLEKLEYLTAAHPAICPLAPPLLTQLSELPVKFDKHLIDHSTYELAKAARIRGRVEVYAIIGGSIGLVFTGVSSVAALLVTLGVI